MGKLRQPDSYQLPYAFPDGRAWAAIRDGIVMNMIYMKLPEGFGDSFDAFRQQSRAALAREGAVWAGEVKGGRFAPKYESSDHRAKS